MIFYNRINLPYARAAFPGAGRHQGPQKAELNGQSQLPTQKKVSFCGQQRNRHTQTGPSTPPTQDLRIKEASDGRNHQLQGIAQSTHAENQEG
jgi:hypothetical protein